MLLAMHDLIQLGPGMSPDQASFGTEDGSCGYGLLQARFRACLTSIRVFWWPRGAGIKYPFLRLGQRRGSALFVDPALYLMNQHWCNSSC